MVLCGDETPSIIFFLNFLMTWCQIGSMNMHMVCILIRSGNHLSEAVCVSNPPSDGLCVVVVVAVVVMDKPCLHLLSMHKMRV